MDVGLYAIFGGHQVDIVPHIFRHYINQGIDPENFYIAYHDNPNFQELKDQYYSYFDEYGVQPKIVIDGDLQANNGKWPSILDHLRSTCSNEWIVRIDMDEFHEYPNGLSELIEQCSNYDYVIGVWADRLAVDGKFNKIQKDVSLWKQFPLIFTDYAKLEFLADTAKNNLNDNYLVKKPPYFTHTKKYRPVGSKMALARTKFSHAGSSHTIADHAKCRRFPVLITTHHFRFTDSCVVHCDVLSENEYSDARKNVLRYLQYDKITNSINMNLIKFLIQEIETPKGFYYNENYPTNLPEPSWL